MKIVLQRVSSASVSFSGRKNSISEGLLLFIGIHQNDEKKNADYLLEKCLKLRIFEDDSQRMMLSVLDIKGSILAISQFTLYADTRKGRRPSFIDAAKPEKAEELYDYFVDELKKSMLIVETGKFAADMQVHIENNGPVTIILEN